MNKEILNNLNKVITSLENQGFTKEANSLNNIFIHLLQNFLVISKFKFLKLMI